MDERAKIPVTLPRNNPTQSYWQDPPDAIADSRTTDSLPETTDVVIVGSGITGAAVAWSLLQNSGAERQSIVMLEARQTCSGATGRNGGHTKAGSYRSFLAHAHDLGTSAAVQIARLELANIRAVHAFAREHAIACDSHPCDTIDVIYDPAQWAQARVAVAAIQAALPPDDPVAAYRLIDADEVRERFYCHDGGALHGEDGEDNMGENKNTEKICGGVLYEAGSLAPYLFVTSLLKMCLERGLNLQTNTPALRLVRDSGASSGSGDGQDRYPWTVHTPRGKIAARRVVLATNGYTAHLVPRLQGVIVPLRGQVTAQRAGRGLPHNGSLPTTYSFIYDQGYEYMVPRPADALRFAGDIVIGGGLVRAPEAGLCEYGTTDDTTLNETISPYLRDAAARYFGTDWGADDPAGRVRKEWTGIMGYSPDGMPLVGQMPGEPELWLSCSFQGHGMVLCWMCARALVGMMEGRDGDALRAWFPEAFRISEDRMAKRFSGRLHTTSAMGTEMAK